MIGWVVSGALGLVGGAISGDLVAKRSFRREHKAKEAARLADWTLTPTGTAMAELRNTGDEPGLQIELQWAEGSTGQIEEQPVDRIDPNDFRRLRVAPFSELRQVIISWKRPTGEHKSVQREVPRFRK